MDPIAPEAVGCAAAARGWSGAPLDTARLWLRAWRPEDADAVAALLDTPEMASFGDALPHPYTRHDAAAVIASAQAGYRAGDRPPALAIEDRLTGELVGGLAARMQGQVPHLAYWVARARWGQGIATEAVRRYIRLLFDGFDSPSLAARVQSENYASHRVLRKLGFADDGPARLGHEHFSLERSAWQAARAARPLLLVVAAALIDPDGRVLLAQRPAGKSLAGFWEFPGGKLDPGETPEQALVRELQEELGIDTSASCLAPLAFASHDYDTMHLMMPLYVCRQWRGQPVGREGQALRWVRPARLLDLPLPPADWPLAAALRDWL